MSLHNYFKARDIAMVDVAPGVSTPRCFSDARCEHLTTRRAAGLFDFSFMACFDITGRESLPYLEHLQVRNLHGLQPGRIAYTLMCREDGVVINDATVWCHSHDHYWLFTGRRTDRMHLEHVAGGYEIRQTECSLRHSVCAVQGPRSLEVLQRCFPDQAWGTLPYYGFRRHEFLGAPCWVGRIGYCGEVGYEVVTDAGAAPALWQRLVAVGGSSALRECGFESADGLRIEAGHILFTRELAIPVTPYELGLGRLVSQYGAAFVGADELRARRWEQPKRRLAGLLPKDSHEDTVRSLLAQGGPEPAETDVTVRPGTGRLTSVCLSPVYGRLLALGYVAGEDRYPGTRVMLGHGRSAQVARLPFYDPAKRLPRNGP